MAEPTVTDIVPGLRKCATAVFLATEEGPARDISDRLTAAANEIEQLRDVLNKFADITTAYLVPDGISEGDVVRRILELDSHPGWILASRLSAK